MRNVKPIQIGKHLRLELEDDGGARFIRLTDEQPADEGEDPIEIEIELRDVDAVIAALQQLKSQA